MTNFSMFSLKQSYHIEVQFSKNCKSYDNFKEIKSRLTSHVKYWENKGACPFVLDPINNDVLSET